MQERAAKRSEREARTPWRKKVDERLSFVEATAARLKARVAAAKRS